MLARLPSFLHIHPYQNDMIAVMEDIRPICKLLIFIYLKYYLELAQRLRYTMGKPNNKKDLKGANNEKVYVYFTRSCGL